jgi:transcriptional regulator with XRE-family HTH domain
MAWRPEIPPPALPQPLGAGYLILLARELSGLSQRALASEMGRSQPSPATLETGTPRPRSERSCIADAAGLELVLGLRRPAGTGPHPSRAREPRVLAPRRAASEPGGRPRRLRRVPRAQAVGGTRVAQGVELRGEGRYRFRLWGAHSSPDQPRYRSRYRAPQRIGTGSAAAGAGAAATPAGRGTAVGRRRRARHERVLAPDALAPAVRARERRVHGCLHRAPLLEPVLTRHADVLVGRHDRRIPWAATSRNIRPGSCR